MPTWSVVLLKRHGKRGIYCGEFELRLDLVPDSADDKYTSALRYMASQAAHKFCVTRTGFALYANHKARLLEVIPL